MVELGQQSMLERPKPRSMIVPAGSTAWWGVDPSTRGVSIGWVTGDGTRGVLTERFPRMPAMARLSVIYEGAAALAEVVADRHGIVPGVIGVEQPSGSGQQVNHELEFAVGVIIAGIYDGVKRLYGPPTMELVVGSWWKARSCGNGAARKTRKVEGKKNAQSLPLEEYEVMKWARLNGYRGSSWDEADALGVAEAMRVEIELVPRGRSGS